MGKQDLGTQNRRIHSMMREFHLLWRMLNLPPLTELRAFEAAASHLSFKSAADELGVTPTAISHQIRLLEEYCEQPLFRRRPRPLALTESGSKLFSVVREGLDSFSIAISGVREGAEQRPLKV